MKLNTSIMWTTKANNEEWLILGGIDMVTEDFVVVIFLSGMLLPK